MNRAINMSIVKLSSDSGLCLTVCRNVTDCFGCYSSCHVCYAGGVGC